MSDILQQAIQLHTSGQFDAAAALYRQVLEQNPEHADALHLLGVIHLQQNQPALAVAILSRAVSLRPQAAEYYVNLPGASARQSGVAFSCSEKDERSLRTLAASSGS